MSDNTQGSGGSRKSLIGRIQISPDTANSWKNGFSQFKGSFTDSISRGVESFKGKGHMPKSGREASVYSKGVRELDNYGYERYNIGGDSEIFISKVSDKALFNDGEPVLVRATEGNFVGSAQLPYYNDKETAETEVADTRTMFCNVPQSSGAAKEFHASIGTVQGGSVKPVQETVLADVSAKPVQESEVKEAPVINTSFLGKMSRVTTPANTSKNISVEFEDDEGDDMVIIQSSEPAESEKAIEKTTATVPVQAESEKVPVAEPAVQEVHAPEVSEMKTEPVVEKKEPAVKKMPDFMSRIKSGTRPIVKPAAESPVVDAPAQKAEPAVESVAEPEEVFYGLPCGSEASAVVAPVVEESLPCDNNLEDDLNNEIFMEEYDEEPVQDAEASAEPVVTGSDSPVIEEEPLFAEEEVILVEEEPVIVEAVAEPSEPVAQVDMDAVIDQVVAESVAEQIAFEQVLDSVVCREMERQPEPAETIPVEEPKANAATAAIRMMGDGASSVETSSVASNISVDGEALPPMSDPVRTRPRSVRFRFNNGVLTKVAEQELKEGLQSPLE